MYWFKDNYGVPECHVIWTACIERSTLLGADPKRASSVSFHLLASSFQLPASTFNDIRFPASLCFSFSFLLSHPSSSIRPVCRIHILHGSLLLKTVHPFIIHHPSSIIHQSIHLRLTFLVLVRGVPYMYCMYCTYRYFYIHIGPPFCVLECLLYDCR